MLMMREVFADFNRLGERPGLGLSVLLGDEDAKPDLATLTDGEHVLLAEPENLCAEGIVRSETSSGRRYWYGIIASMDAIHDIHPETLAEQSHRDDAASA